MEWDDRTTSVRRTRRHGGFTLVELLVAAAIMGLLFVALMEAFKVGLQMLEHGQRMTVASSLAEEVHQMTLTMPLADPEEPTHWGLEAGESPPPFDDLDDLDGQTFSPPVNADGLTIAGLADYQQQVSVVSVSEQDFDAVVGDGLSGVPRVTVVVTCQGTEICRMSWLVVGQL